MVQPSRDDERGSIMKIRSRKVRFLLIVGALLTGGSACSSAHPIDEDADVERDADADEAGSRDADAERDIGVDADAPVDADVEGLTCPDPWQIIESWNVQSPPEGVEPTGDALCAAPADPAETGGAGRLTLTLYSASIDRAVGQIAIPGELQPLVIDVPRIEIVDAMPPTIGVVSFSDVAPNGQGFSFNALWPEPFEGEPDWQYPSLTLRVQFEIRCDETGDERKTISALTYLNLCDDTEHPMWISSGDECRVCLEVCEMAPCPVVPKPRADGTALPRALELEIVPVALVGRSLCVVAEHRGAEGAVTYRWNVSSGVLGEGSLGGAVWEMPNSRGPHVIQVAVEDSDSAAVASLVWPRDGR